MTSIVPSSPTSWLRTRVNCWQSTAGDCFCLLVIGMLSMASYEFPLGFYSDDWAMLASMSLSQSQSFVDVFRELYYVHDHEIRPMQFLEIAVLYKLFGLASIGYHLLNAVILIMDFVLLYLLALD